VPPARPRGTALFLALALGFAAVYGALVLCSQRGLLSFAMPESTAGTVLKALLRDFGPALAALIAAAWSGGRAAMRELLAGLARWRLSARVWLLALLGPFLAMAVVVLVGTATGTLQRGGLTRSPLQLAVVFLLMAIVDGPLGEEVGWRGFLLPRLLERTGALQASLVVGVVWWLWHVPLYTVDGRDMSVVAWGDFLLTTVALAVVFTWFWLRSGGSTLLSIVLHDTCNFSVYLLLKQIWVRSGDAILPRLVYDAIVVAAAVAAGIALRAPQLAVDRSRTR